MKATKLDIGVPLREEQASAASTSGSMPCISLRLSLSALFVSTSAFAIAPPALAQTTPPAVAVDAGASSEIVVTATRRNEGINKVPISINAFSQAALEASGVKGIDQIASLTPGVQFDQTSSFGPGTLTNIAIRGITSLNGSSTTGIYFDDTVLGAHLTPVSVFSNPFPAAFDLARVEVLRGPQGTLFGAGSEGGTIRFIPNAPSVTTYSGMVESEVSYTDGGDVSYEGGVAVGGPIIQDKLGFRASAWYRRDGGFVDRVSPFPGNSVVQKNANWQGVQAYRVALAAKPAEWLTITPSFLLQSSHRNDSGAYFEYLSNPSDGVLKNGRLLRQPSTDNLYISSLKVEADLGAAAFTSISSYVHRKGRATADQTNGAPISLVYGIGYDGLPLTVPFNITQFIPRSQSDASPADLSIKQDVYSQEARIASSDPSARFSWVVGAYYSHSRQRDTFSQYSSVAAAAYGAASPDEVIFRQDPTNTAIQFAGFGQIDYKLTDKLKATAGLRVGHIKTSQTVILDGVLNTLFGTAGVFKEAQKESSITPKFSLSYQLDSNNLFYASAGKGFREGGANPPILPPPVCPAANATYNSDSLWSYEAGAKNKLFDGHLQLATSVYHIDWKNIQTVQPLSCGFYTIFNAGSTSTTGFDIAAQARLGTHWQIGASVAYNDSHYSKTVNGLDNDGNPTIPFIKSGDVVGVPPQVPSPWNVTASIEYDFKIFGDNDAFIRVENIFHSHNSGPYVDTVNSFLRADPSTNLLNVRTGVSLSGYDLALFVNNVLNSHPVLGEYNDSGGTPVTVATTFRPLTAGFSASYKF